MPPKLKIEVIHAASHPDKLNEEWIELHNEGDAPFNGEGCSITVARGNGRPRVVTTMKAGLIIKPQERVRIVTGSSGKKTHGEAPGGDVRNFHLFLKAPYVESSDVTVRVVNRQLEICKASSATEAASAG
ncbi:MAG: hypothetical protein IT371_03730 [Deltaproteobacteria bacterium]|nr:hypothetical protein [Deltaproteobacteria bacterium]